MKKYKNIIYTPIIIVLGLGLVLSFSGLLDDNIPFSETFVQLVTLFAGYILFWLLSLWTDGRIKWLFRTILILIHICLIYAIGFGFLWRFAGSY